MGKSIPYVLRVPAKGKVHYEPELSVSIIITVVTLAFGWSLSEGNLYVTLQQQKWTLGVVTAACRKNSNRLHKK